MALEEYIKQVKEIWSNYTLDLVNYQNKCRLIRLVSAQFIAETAAYVHAEDGTIFSTNAARISTLL